MVSHDVQDSIQMTGPTQQFEDNSRLIPDDC
jgi:hypothetical protein